MPKITSNIAIIGGGVIGLAIALRLRAEGREVTVIERDVPGGGASFGNAGAIADYAVLPVGSPAVLRNVFSLLFNPASPLSIRTTAIPSLLPWMVRFSYESLPHRFKENARRIAELVSGASAAWRELLVEIGASDLINPNGCLYTYSTHRAFQAASAGIELQRSLGVSQEVLSAEEVRKLEPRMARVEGGGVLYPDSINLSDPGRVMSLLKSAAEQAGVMFLQASATAVRRTEAGILISAAPYEALARTVIIAAGAHSSKFAAQLGDPVRMDTERGYHLEYDMTELPFSRSVCPAEYGFYFCPMKGRLRIAGTVELGGLTALPNPRRIDVMKQNARKILPELGEPDRIWMGFRPSTPDSVPVVRPSKGGKEAIFAFGHGHIGVTLAPQTARMVSAIIASNRG
jgi:D-hydroxyproline dehydrogenase